MLQYLKGKRGQSTLEYAVLVCVIIGALVAVQTYVKRGVQGRMKSAADDIGDQYSPDNMNELVTSTRNSLSYENSLGGVTETNLIAENSASTMNTVMVNTAQEYWGTTQ